MMLNALTGDIPRISKALNSLDSAFSSNSTIVPSVQDALLYFKYAMSLERFLDPNTTYHSQQYLLEEAALQHSLQHLTTAVAEVDLRLTAFKQSIISSNAVVPVTLSNDDEVVAALHLAVIDPRQINLYLVNEALNNLVYLTTGNVLGIQSRRLLMKSVWESDSFLVYVVTVLNSGNIHQIITSLKALNKVIGLFKDYLRCSTLLFDTLVT
jgi:hypothetical protein